MVIALAKVKDTDQDSSVWADDNQTFVKTIIRIIFSKIRLSGSQHYSMGRVDVKINGRWGVICGDRWTMMNTVIVCRQLGLGYAAGNWSTSHFGRTGKILLSGVTCLGHENSLDECLRHDNLTCSQTKRFAAVRCNKGKYSSIALILPS